MITLFTPKGNLAVTIFDSHKTMSNLDKPLV